jgi:hypothetical protein
MLKRFVDSLWRRVETDLKEWRSTSHTRKAFAYTRVQSLVLGASQRPLHSNSVVLLIVVVLSALVWIVAYQSELQEPALTAPRI